MLCEREGGLPGIISPDNVCTRMCSSLIMRIIWFVKLYENIFERKKRRLWTVFQNLSISRVN